MIAGGNRKENMRYTSFTNQDEEMEENQLSSNFEAEFDRAADEKAF